MMSAIKKSVVVLKAGILCLAQALIIAMARENGDPRYASYRHGYGWEQQLEDFLEASGLI